MFGKFELWFVISMILFLFPLFNRRYKKRYYWFVLILPSLLLASTITFFLKESFKILRPCHGLPDCPSGYSFPSGHSTVIFSVVTAILLNERKKKFLTMFLILSAILISTSRIVLNHHTVLDVFAGSVIGFASSAFINELYVHWKKRSGETGI